MKRESTVCRVRLPWMILVVLSAFLAVAVSPSAALADESGESLTMASPAGELAIQAGDIASGVWGTCNWELSAEGVLRIHPGQAGDVYSASWRDWTYSITSINAPVQDGKKIVCSNSMDYVFCALSKLKSADLSGFDTSQVTSMRSVFNSCESLTSLNLKGWTTPQVTDMADMFSYCPKLKSLNLKAFNTSNVRLMDGMFASCSALTSLDLSSFNTKRLESSRSMFSSCSSLKTLDLSSFNTSSVTRCDNMFKGCDKLNKLKVGTNYKITNDEMIPAATARTGMWWSTTKKAWVPKSSIVSNRSGKADTYLASGKDVGKASLGSAEVTLSQYRYTYTGAKRLPEVTVTMYGQVLKKGTDYSLVYTHCRSVGKAHVIVKGKGLFEGEKTITYTIAAAPISNASFSMVKDADYTGNSIKPSLTITFNDKKLDSKSYTVTYKDNVNAGKASIIVKGKGNFTGTKTVTFKIRPVSISKAKVSDIAEKTYTGKPLKPSVKVTYKGNTLGKSDYSLTYANNEDVGTAIITIVGKGNFKDTAKASFKIKQANISGAKIGKIGEVPYTGKAVEPSPTVTWNNMTLRSGSDYSLDYKNNVNPGTATVVVKGEGNFKGQISTTFKVGKPANPMTVKVASMSVAYNELYTAGKTFSPLTVSNAVGDVTCAVVSKNAALSFNTKTGKLTVLKGTYPGTYTMKVKVTAAGSEKYAAASKTVELTVTVSGTIKQNETESNDKLADANQMIIGANMHGEFRQNDSDWFFVEVKNPGYYKLELTMDEYVEQGGNINAYLYENADTLSSQKVFTAVYQNEEKKSSTSPSLYLPKGYSYINVGGYVSWTGKFKYHIRLIKE